MPNHKVGSPSPPQFLSQVPKAVVRALDVSEVFRDALTSMKHLAKYGPVIALSTIESYFKVIINYFLEATIYCCFITFHTLQMCLYRELFIITYFNAAKRQQRRIERAKASIHKSFLHPTGVNRVKNLFDDVHFYLIVWARIAKLARFIQETTRFSRTGVVLRRFHAELKDRIDARDHLEHFEERLPGSKKQSKLAVPNDLPCLLNMANQYLTYGGRRIDIGPDSIRLLKTIHDEFFTAILFDFTEVLAKEDQSCLSLLFKRAVSKVQVARTTRKVQNILKGKA